MPTESNQPDKQTEQFITTAIKNGVTDFIIAFRTPTGITLTNFSLINPEPIFLKLEKTMKKILIEQEQQENN